MGWRKRSLRLWPEHGPRTAVAPLLREPVPSHGPGPGERSRPPEKRLNVKFLAGLLAGATLFVIGMHVIHGFQVKCNAGALLRRTDQAERDGNLQLAVDYLSQYLAFAPADAEALARYGLLLAEPGLIKSPKAVQRAYLVLENSLRRSPERQDVRRRAVRLAMDLRRFTEVGEHLTYLLRAHPEDGELQVLLGRCHEATREYQQARRAYEAAIGHPPAAIETYGRLASLLRRRAEDVLQGKETKSEVLRLADERIEEMVRGHERSFRAYLLRARYRQEVAPSADDPATFAAAEQDVRRAQELAPDEVEVIVAAAELGQRQAARAAREQPDAPAARDYRAKVRTLLERGNQRHPQEWRLYQALARLEVQEGHPEAALTWLRTGLKHLSRQHDLRWDLAELLIQQRQFREAADAIQRLGREGFLPAALDYLNASLLAQEESWGPAAEFLERAYLLLLGQTYPSQDGFGADVAQRTGLLLGRCYEQLGDADRANAAYARVVAQDPRSVAGRLGVAATHATMGRLGEALDQYEQVLRLPGAPPAAWMEVARLLILRNLGSDRPDWREVDKVLAESEQLRPRPIQVVILRAEYYVGQKQFDRARAVLEAESTADGRRPVEVWVALAELEERQGNPAAPAVLAEAERQLGDRVELRLARARYCGRHPGAEARADLARLVPGMEKFSREDQEQLLRGVARAYNQIGEADESERLWGQLAERRPNLLDAKVVLFDLALQRGDEETMQRRIQEIKKTEGDGGAIWRFCQVGRLIHRATQRHKEGLEEARSLLAVVARQRPNWGRVPLCEAEIDDLQGNGVAALVNYRRAIQMGERGTLATRRAVELLYQHGRHAEAYQLLRDMPEPTFSAGNLPRVAAEVALRAQDKARALSYAQKAVANESKDFRDYIWLGQIYWAAGDLKKAEAALYRARALADTEPDAWVALVFYLAASNQIAKAQAELDRAEHKLARDSAALALAQCCEAVGRLEKANELYRAAVAAKPDDLATLSGAAAFFMRTGQVQDAQRHLVKIRDQFREAAPEAAGWARRMLAVLLTLQGDYRQAREALAMLAPDSGLPGKASGDDPVQDKRTKAMILAMRPNRQERKEAIRILEGLLERRTATPDDQFLLAQLYETTGDWPKARKRLLALIGLPEGHQAAYLSHFARSMLGHGERDEAEAALKKLERIEPAAYGTLEIRARVLYASGKKAEAVALLQSHVKDSPADTGAVAVLLEELGEAEGAEALYRELVNRSKQPESTFVLVHFWRRQHRYQEALDACDRAWQTCRPEAVAQACLSVLAEAPHDPAQYARVERRLQEAVQKAPKALGLQAASAVLAKLQDRYNEVEAVYRRILELDPRNAPALNNLAWLLACQGRGPEALELVRRAYEIKGPDPGLLDTRAVAYLAIGQSGLALKDLEEAVTESSSPDVYFHLARAYHMARDRKAAREALRRARAGGIKEADLHPRERLVYRELVRDLNPG